MSTESKLFKVFWDHQSLVVRSTDEYEAVDIVLAFLFPTETSGLLYDPPSLAFTPSPLLDGVKKFIAQWPDRVLCAGAVQEVQEVQGAFYNVRMNRNKEEVWYQVLGGKEPALTFTSFPPLDEGSNDLRGVLS